MTNLIDINTLAAALKQVAGVPQGVGYGQPGRYTTPLQPWQTGKKEASLTITSTTLYSCCGLFSVCGPDAVLSRVVTDDKLSEWLGWVENNECYQFVKTITWIGNSGTAAGSADSAAGEPCDDPPTVEWGACEYLIQKGLLRKCGDPIDLTVVGEKYCDKQPLYDFMGQRIDNDLEWQAIMAGIALKNDIARLAVVGSNAVAGEFDGLEQLVNTGYVDVHTAQPCEPVDSLVTDWSNAVVNNTLIELVFAYIRRIRQRAQNRGGIAPNDMVIMMPSFLRDCFMDAWICYGFCDETADSTSRWETRDRDQRFRGGGLFGDGFIIVDGVDVPLMVNDWIPVTSVAPNFCSDIYILTRRLGNLPIFHFQYQNLNISAAAFHTQLLYTLMPYSVLESSHVSFKAYGCIR